MDCSSCEKSMSQGTYICSDSDFRIVDEDGNLILSTSDHDLPSGDDEIGTSSEVYYCSCKTIQFIE